MSITLSSATPSFERTSTKPLIKRLHTWPFLSSAFSASTYQGTADARRVHVGNKPKAPPPELESDSEEGLALPVEPDEGTVLIPDDERVINVPS